MATENIGQDRVGLVSIPSLEVTQESAVDSLEELRGNHEQVLRDIVEAYLNETVGEKSRESLANYFLLKDHQIEVLRPAGSQTGRYRLTYDGPGDNSLADIFSKETFDEAVDYIWTNGVVPKLEQAPNGPINVDIVTEELKKLVVTEESPNFLSGVLANEQGDKTEKSREARKQLAEVLEALNSAILEETKAILSTKEDTKEDMARDRKEIEELKTINSGLSQQLSDISRQLAAIEAAVNSHQLARIAEGGQNLPQEPPKEQSVVNQQNENPSQVIHIINDQPKESVEENVELSPEAAEAKMKQELAELLEQAGAKLKSLQEENKLGQNYYWIRDSEFLATIDEMKDKTGEELKLALESEVDKYKQIYDSCEGDGVEQAHLFLSDVYRKFVKIASGAPGVAENIKARLAQAVENPAEKIIENPEVSKESAESTLGPLLQMMQKLQYEWGKTRDDLPGIDKPDEDPEVMVVDNILERISEMINSTHPDNTAPLSEMTQVFAEALPQIKREESRQFLRELAMDLASSLRSASPDLAVAIEQAVPAEAAKIIEQEELEMPEIRQALAVRIAGAKEYLKVLEEGHKIDEVALNELKGTLDLWSAGIQDPSKVALSDIPPVWGSICARNFNAFDGNQDALSFLASFGIDYIEIIKPTDPALAQAMHEAIPPETRDSMDKVLGRNEAADIISKTIIRLKGFLDADQIDLDQYNPLYDTLQKLADQLNDNKSVDEFVANLRILPDSWRQAYDQCKSILGMQLLARFAAELISCLQTWVPEMAIALQEVIPPDVAKFKQLQNLAEAA
ncbi:MAG: hypothetical protein A2445_02305 [Candidatus Jacksonbacteria bacterium RIFOXYC2_FULL_44_29]|nr:MAG: hypothetical protein UW45_C0045G0005 [Parcubacteria group bacterium GW2011_GWC2_44_22]OGY75490.1 MAG: hypothetical protein A2240_03185 [Candidatus Jacksonbacteria bacterium RIFOXYA2_FULL_43_12]OGY76986.1 MAG: hypothetical protein A2295_01290 [Candidatus Jacksonbacteria bacterium RIFOXYB2_FULL_44_15]OGY77838.1 MAG: hypothetical protein A2445_02305 [Candidatus Jacksonbacteria bacterium RIFOXYC2_FULL_44_29]OGY80255.1 MAG: hypothetical protein A2550_03955 [Candidatus Jacksonbacteria bacteri